MRVARHASGAWPASSPQRILLVAGEASGDLHAADLLRALRQQRPDVQVFGIGGPHLREVGMETLVDAADVATVGATEAIGRLRMLLRAYRRLAAAIQQSPPDLCIFVDFPEFNLRMARLAKRQGIPVLYYIGPQVWAWRRGRVRKIARRVDRLAVVFPFEPSLYAHRTQTVEFVGHPLLDRVRVTADRATTLARHGLDPRRRTIVLLPGSRHSEITHLLPAMLAARAELQTDSDPPQFVLALAHTLSPAAVEPALQAAHASMPIVTGDTYNLVASADLALVASGTATLECALLECPMVIVYRVSPVTWTLARLLVRGVRHIGMPNIVAGRGIVPELLQGRVTGPAIAAAAREVLGSPERRATMVADLRDVRRRLGSGGAARRAAAIAVEMLEQGST